jgi:hypothetical protein
MHLTNSFGRHLCPPLKNRCRKQERSEERDRKKSGSRIELKNFAKKK